MNRYNIMFVVAAIMLSSIGLIAVTAAECCDVKCVWEPCGTKVQQSDVDAVYALKPIKAMWAYQDADSDGKFDDNDVLIIDTVLDQDAQGNWIGAWVIEEGDVRLSNYHETPANTKVISTDGDRGKPLKELPGGQMVVGFVDVNNDDHYDLGDPLYADTDNSSTVTPNDVRLTERIVNIMTYPAYSRVQSDDWDVGNELRDPVTFANVITTNSVTLLGYIDSDCDCHWTCPDKLYLQQITGTIADKFVTIGDHRLYIPQEAINAPEYWPECGTKVEQCDKDAVYVLAKDDQIRIMFGDVNSNGGYDQGEAIYLDMVNNGDDKVEAGDVRLTWFHNEPPNYKITSLDPDRTDPLEELCGGQAVIGFVDVNSDGVYDKYDPLYIDTDCSSDVTAGDIRLTEREAMGTTYDCWTMVENGDFDQILNEDLLDPVTYGINLVTEIWFMLGYIDSDCSGDWTCPDKLYLQQIVSEDGDSTADWVVTIGDHRMYIPQEAIDDHCWPECCTKVQQCDVDAVYVLTKDDQIRIMYGDVNSNGQYDIGETVYIDMVDNGQDKVEAGDVRLTWYHDMYPPNTKVNSTNIDKNNPLEELCDSQAVVGFVDLNNNEVYDKHDPLYVDTDCNSRVSVGDVRLTQRMASGRTYEPYTLVNQGDYDLIGETDLRDPVAPYGTHLVTEIWELLGYIDSDCSGDWTCPDKLYLQQIVDIQDVKADDVVSIGDLRLYIPPEEIGPVDDDDPCVIYDTNGVAGIQKDEAVEAINDYLIHGTIDKKTAVEVLNCYFGLP